MKIFFLGLIFASNAWAVAILPELDGSGAGPVVGHMYAFVTAYGSGHHLDCPGATCTYPFRGPLPSFLASVPVSTKTGGIKCPTCQMGIYTFDAYHYIFVYN